MTAPPLLHRRLLLAASLLAGLAAPAAAETVTVFAAASLTDAMEAIGEAWETEHGVEHGEHEIRFSFASSSTLARQIEAGAPADIYASASEDWMDYLAERGLVEAATRTSPIGNHLVLIAPADSPVELPAIGPDLDLAGLLGEGGRLAVGDSDHVPAGRHARAALESLGLWEEAEPLLARADNVRAALALVEAGEVRLGIVYETDARVSDRVRVLGRFPEESHEPISYPFAIVAGRDTAAVRAVFGYLLGEDAAARFEAAGFTVGE